MRLADVVLRGGHLSDQALMEVCVAGGRPAHLDRCDLCAERAVAMSRWLDDVRAAGIETADAAFPAERLAAQQVQILRRLEQIDHPARVIAFPSQARLNRAESTRRRISLAWTGAAAAAGLLIGIFGTEMTGRFIRSSVPVETAPQQVAEAVSHEEAERLAAIDGSLMDDIDAPPIKFLEALDELTPRVVRPTGAQVNR